MPLGFAFALNVVVRVTLIKGRLIILLLGIKRKKKKKVKGKRERERKGKEMCFFFFFFFYNFELIGKPKNDWLQGGFTKVIDQIQLFKLSICVKV